MGPHQNKTGLLFYVIYLFTYLLCFVWNQLNEPVTVELETIAKVRPPSKVMQPDEENDVTTVRCQLFTFCLHQLAPGLTRYICI